MLAFLENTPDGVFISSCRAAESQVDSQEFLIIVDTAIADY